MTAKLELISSRHSPLFMRLRKLAADPAAYRKQGAVWLEGEHLCSAFHAHGGRRPDLAVVAERGAARPDLSGLAQSAVKQVLLADALFDAIDGTSSREAIGFVIAAPVAPAIAAGETSVVLDRLQDPGNVGSILRSAAAFGVKQVLALQGTAALWSPKVLRAAMGAHFGLRLIEGLGEDQLDALTMPWVATSSHGGALLHDAPLPTPLAWLLGHEGMGISVSLQRRCALTIRIPQPGGQESLNVAAAAAVLFYEMARRAV